MKLHHIALNIQTKKELVDFYQNILGVYPQHQFNLYLDLATKIFNIEQQPEVFQYKNEHLFLELFFYEETTIQGFAHICLEVADRENIAKKAEIAGYPVARVARKEMPDILFIKDKTGNIFELKDIEQ